MSKTNLTLALQTSALTASCLPARRSALSTTRWPVALALLTALFALASVAPAARTAESPPTPLLTKRSEATLLAVLKSDAPIKDKADACRELGIVGTKESVPVLAAMLPDEKLNHIARYALEPNPDASVDVALRDALGKLQGRPLVGVIGSIGVRKDAQAVTALSGKLGDSDADVAQAAARALGKIGSADAAKAIQNALPKTAPGNHLAFCEGLLRCAEALSAAGQREPALGIYDQLRTMASAAFQVRVGGLRGAIMTRGKDGVPLLIEAIRGADWTLVGAAARTALEMSEPAVTAALAEELAKLSGDKKILVSQVLGKRADPAALPALFAAAKSGEPTTRIAALRALPEIGHASAAPVLVDLLADADREIAQAAQDGLAALQGKEVDAAVLALLNAPDAARRVTALDLLARRRMTSALPAVAKATSDTDAKVRATAIKRLGDLSSANDLPMLADLLLKAKPGQEMEAAEQALTAVATRTGDPEATSAKLSALLGQAQPESKAALLRVLSAVGGKNALAALRGAVKDSDPEIRNASIRALGDWKTADAAPDLLALAKAATDPKEKLLCLRSYVGLARNTDFPADQRLAMCVDVTGLMQSKDEKRLLLSALGSIQTMPSLNLITPYLDDESIKNEAGAAVVAIADKLLKGRDISKIGPKLVAPLEKVAANTANADLSKRAAVLLKQAQGAGAK